MQEIIFLLGVLVGITFCCALGWFVVIPYLMVTADGGSPDDDYESDGDDE